MFDGNTDRNTHVTSLFASMVIARHIKVRPQQWHGHISLRMEIIGCDYGMYQGSVGFTKLSLKSC